MNKVTMFNTSCGSCIFNKNKYENINEVDCSLGRYEIFEKRGEVQEGMINRLCSACRDSDWRDAVNGNPAESIKFELQNSYSIIIFDNNKGVLDRLKHTLSVKQTVAPRQIIVVYSDDTPLDDISREISYHIRDTETQYHTIKTWGEKTDREMIDIAVKKCDGLFYILCEAGDVLDEQAIEILYNEIDVKLEKLIYVRPYNKLNLTGSAIHLRFHLMVNGNVIKNIEEKLDEALEVENQKDFFKDWTSLCLN